MRVPPLASETFTAAVDHTLLDATAGAAAIDVLCDQAALHGFAAVCVFPWWVERCAARLRGGPAVCTVVAFPHGLDQTGSKCEAVRRAIASGAGEVDVVIAWGPLAAGDVEGPAADASAVVQAARGEDPAAVVKLIVETTMLDAVSLRTAARVVAESGAAFAKTSTGMHGGATAGHVSELRSALPPGVRIKASGGIRTAAQAAAMLGAGADRLGTSAALAILEELSVHAVA
jgi:deoxyribose-phosphate aldolase